MHPEDIDQVERGLYLVQLGDPPSSPFGPFCYLHTREFVSRFKLHRLTPADADALCVSCTAIADGRQLYGEPVDAETGLPQQVEP